MLLARVFLREVAARSARTALPVAPRPAAALVSGGAANRFRLFIHHIAATQDEAGEKSFDEGLESGPKAGKSKGKKQYA